MCPAWRAPRIRNAPKLGRERTPPHLTSGRKQVATASLPPTIAGSVFLAVLKCVDAATRNPIFLFLLFGLFLLR